MRLLFINYEFPPLGGGGGFANQQIAAQMATLGHEVYVMTSAYKGLPGQEERDGYTIIRIPAWRRYQEKCRIHEMLTFLISALWHAPSLAKKYSFDLCVAFFTIPSAPAAWLLKKLKGIPYVVSLRGGDVPGFMKEQLAFFHWLTKPMIKSIWRNARAVVANSQGLKNLALKTLKNSPMTVIPNGVDTRYFQKSVVAETFSQKKAFTFLSVGRFSEQKGLDTLLQAFCQVCHSHRSANPRLWLVGDGPLKNELVSLSHALGIEKHVTFFGWKSHDELRAIYERADAFVLASLYEGMPNVVLEAMAMGLPVIGTRVEGTEEIVEPGVNGHLVGPRDVAGMARAMGEIMLDPELHRTQANGARTTALGYGWQDVALRYLKICEAPS